MPVLGPAPVLTAVALVAAPAQSGIEVVQNLGRDRGNAEMAEPGLEVFGHRVAVGAAGGVGGVHQVDVALQQLGDGDVGAGPAVVADLVDEAAAGGFGVGECGRAVGDGVAEAALAAGDGMDAGVDPVPAASHWEDGWSSLGHPAGPEEPCGSAEWWSCHEPCHAILSKIAGDRPPGSTS
jgi:hypothetical protein